MLLDLLLLPILFLLLGKSADLVVHGVKTITRDYRIPLIFSGLVLGFFTSAPEFFIGISSTVRGINEISFGNLIGGVLVLFGLLTPLHIILNKKVSTKDEFSFFGLLGAVIYLILPLVFALDGVVSFFEGLILVLVYVVLSYVITHNDLRERRIIVSSSSNHKRAFFFVIAGLAAVIIISNFIVKSSINIITELNIPHFWVGLMVFSLGTNLPELIITLRSWKNKSRDLALGNILGSAVTNSLIAGIISMARPIYVEIHFSYITLLIFFTALCILYMFFALTKKRFTLKEGISLLGVYILFLVSQIFFGMNG